MNRINRIFSGVLLLTLGYCTSVNSQPLNQKAGFTRQDSLRGSLNPERTGWDVLYYAISVTPDYTSQSISGTTLIRFKVVRPFQVMQIDLQEPLQIGSIICGNTKLNFTREGNAFHVQFPAPLKAGKTDSVLITYNGKPRVAKRPPWDGGWIFSKDKQGRPWMTVACQGLGASVWYPCKDHQSDEPDQGASLTMIVPDTLIAVANGREYSEKALPGQLKAYTWGVVNPINNYTIIPYIGKYVHWSEKYAGEKGALDCDYWVLDYELEKAKVQFKQVPLMLKSFEHWFGPYPFYEDGYKLIQAPHLGMEHQSAVAYGNRFQNGYLGRDLSGTGWGNKWDFIIVHESGHEWFANNVTSNDIADMWVHEGFTNYSETLFTTSEFGVEAGNDYVIGTRKLISNDIPIIGPFGVNQEGSGDMYYKGGNLLHTIRQVINDDEKFRQILRGIQKKWYHKTCDSKDIEAFISEKSGTDFSKVFDQYLRTTKIPVLEYRREGNSIAYHWTNCVSGFDLPIKVNIDGNPVWIRPKESWSTMKMSAAPGKWEADRNFYIQVKELATDKTE